MAYQVIARKYRPQRFRDVVGQEHVTRTLARAIEQSRIAHAYLFCGPRGTGKTTIARIFAKCLNCTGGPKVDFDEDDLRCQEIADGRAMDVLEIDGASNNGVEQVRELRETVKYAPATSKFKIYIIDEVHMLTAAAFNALLKTLEEPPAHVKFMFATTEPDKVLATILSRCQRFDLRRIPIKLIVEHLDKIGRQEGVQIDPAALHAIARGADGCMRDAESALDQLISFCGQQIVESDVLSMFGLAAQGQILSLAAALLKGDVAGILREFDELSRHGKDLGRLLSDLLHHFRNLLVYAIARGDLKLIEVSELEASSLAEQSALVDSDALARIMEVITNAERGLRDATSKKIFLEVALIRAVEARNAVSLDLVLRQLTRLRQGEPGGTSPAPSPAPLSVRPPAETADVAPATAVAARPTPALLPQPAVVPRGKAPPDLEQLWQQLLEALARVSAFTRSYFIEAHPISLTDKVFTLGFGPELADHITLVDNPKTKALLATKLAELGHPNLVIRFAQADTSPARPVLAPPPTLLVTAPTPAPTPAPTAPAAKPALSPFDPNQFKNDPLIQKALDVFKGQIVEVRT